MEISKFILLLTSLSLLAFGAIYNLKTPLLTGSIIYILSLLFSMIELTILSIKYKKDNLPEEPKDTLLKSLCRIIEMIIVLFGLIETLNKSNNVFATVGRTIWFGAIVSYIISGIVVMWVANIPLEMGYGGWRIKRFYKKREK